MTAISELNIETFKTNAHWDFSNEILYDLCRNNFFHKKEDIILTKVLFIGRIYAAAVERRKNKNKTDISNEEFYTRIIAPDFRKSNLDKRLADLKGRKLSDDTILEVLQAHAELMKRLFDITELEKRSFCSKYLHFHLPDLFFIYDSRALKGIRSISKLTTRELKMHPKQEDVDRDYANFFYRCFDLQQQVESIHKSKLTPRQIDNLLIKMADTIK